MNKEPNSKYPAVLTVSRTKEEARKSYNRISRYYDLLAGIYERKYAKMALDRLSIKEGEAVLEIGYGTGYCLQIIAELVGQMGKGYGIDISDGMKEITKRRLEKAGLGDRIELHLGDGVALPFHSSIFDAVFMSFTLELFDIQEIPEVLQQIKRVLKPAGRLAIISMSKENGKSILSRFYEWLHKKIPEYVDCRPIYVEQSIKQAGFTTKSKARVNLYGLPGEIVIAANSR
jgi:ubiquinone/menaquinone biosynthesis C-methylase UbiE